MALQIHNSSDHKKAFPLSYKDYERSKRAVATYNWQEIGKIEDKTYYISKLNIPNTSLNLSLNIEKDIVLAWKEEGELFISGDVLLLWDKHYLYKCLIEEAVSKVKKVKGFYEPILPTLISTIPKINIKLNNEDKYPRGSWRNPYRYYFM